MARRSPKPPPEFQIETRVGPLTGPREQAALGVLFSMMRKELPAVAERMGVPLFLPSQRPVTS